MFEKIFDDTYIVANKNGKFPDSICTYFDDEVKTLIDTTMDTSFVNYFNDKKVDLIINSHFHKDHCGSNHLFPNAKIIAHPADIPAMQSFTTFCEYFGINDYCSEEEAAELFSWLDFHPSPIHNKIEDGDIIELGKTKLQVVHTPGHTPGHCTFFWEDKGVVFSGDIDLTDFGPWYGHIVSDVDQVINSIEKIMKINPEAIVSGHRGLITDNIQGELRNYLNKVYEKEEKILKALKNPLTLDELTHKKIIYGKWSEPTHFFYFFEKLSLLTHLERLQKLGLVSLENDLYVTK
ncbi:MBL-fold metallo-hydrolase superfamily [Candidatus Syntrophocurvum alkaliphilum]|uniref:MBL-fold metallo-hydrolase superfamily n=1 Tax=Candidatus Syntrophocurvum alkaliphilum TaxID=2293317 RepID=A0A6I6DG50_9FIRM|nr:MBL fold metallo-hydrolase [Candidatus Syntrophocurvum alkaliphilum]QGU00087.1 MBL-fold metallo-hydrolase superfamily [Candidatus Syntrophocurvum alkaliphilum]